MSVSFAKSVFRWKVPELSERLPHQFVGFIALRQFVAVQIFPHLNAIVRNDRLFLFDWNASRDSLHEVGFVLGSAEGVRRIRSDELPDLPTAVQPHDVEVPLGMLFGDARHMDPIWLDLIVRAVDWLAISPVLADLDVLPDADSTVCHSGSLAQAELAKP